MWGSLQVRWCPGCHRRASSVCISAFQDHAEGPEAKSSPLPQERSLHILIRLAIEQSLFGFFLATNESSGEEKVSRNRFSVSVRCIICIAIRLDWTHGRSVVDGASLLDSLEVQHHGSFSSLKMRVRRI